MKKTLLLFILLLYVPLLFSQELNSKVIKVSKKSKKIETTLKDKGLTIKFVWLADKSDNETKFILEDGYKARCSEYTNIRTIWVEDNDTKILNEQQVKDLVDISPCPTGYDCSSAYIKQRNKIPTIITLADKYLSDGSMYTSVIFQYYPIGTNKIVYFTNTYHLSKSNLDLRGKILELSESEGTKYLSIE